MLPKSVEPGHGRMDEHTDTDTDTDRKDALAGLLESSVNKSITAPGGKTLQYQPPLLLVTQDEDTSDRRRQKNCGGCLCGRSDTSKFPKRSPIHTYGMSHLLWFHVSKMDQCIQKVKYPSQRGEHSQADEYKPQ